MIVAYYFWNFSLRSEYGSKGARTRNEDVKCSVGDNIVLNMTPALSETSTPHTPGYFVLKGRALLCL